MPRSQRPPPRQPTRPHGWLRTVATVLGSFVLLLAVALGGLVWWSGTEGSLATALGWVARSQPLVAEQVTGALRKGGRVARLTWQDQGLSVTVRDVALTWQPLSLLSGRLLLQRFSAGHIRIDDQRAAAPRSAGPPASLRLPLPVVLDAFSADTLQWTGPPAFEATGVRGRYEFTGVQHVLELSNAQFAGGRYQGRAGMSAVNTLRLDAVLSGVLESGIPGSQKRLPLALQATATGPLTELLVTAALTLDGAARRGVQPQAKATARVTPWAAQPLPEAQATFRDIDAALLWQGAPQTQLTGTATVSPAGSGAWTLSTALRNAQPGPWDRQRLPLEQLEAAGEWRAGKVLLRSMDAQLAGGRLQASGEWLGNASPGAAAAVQDWRVDASFLRLNPARLHTQLAAQTLNGRTALRGEDGAIRFDTALTSAERANSSTKSALAQLQLRDATAQGVWRAQQAGGTLELAALRVRTNEAELNASGQFQPKAQGGKGKVSLLAPGLRADAEGELRPASGAGQLKLQSHDARLALRWLRSLPGVAAALQPVQAQGQASANLAWQGGWRDPALNATLDLPALDWTASPAASPLAAAPPTDALRFRAVRASLKGRLSQAVLQAQGRIETGARRFKLALAAEGGRAAASRTGPGPAAQWQASVQQLDLSVEDPALGAGAWAVTAQPGFSVLWSPGIFEAGAGQAFLTAPRASGNGVASQAVLAWQALRWRPGELVTAGTLKGLPLAWIELIAGPQLAGVGLAGNLVFDGEWDAVLGAKLRLKAALARSSGDLTLQAETGQGGPTRVAAGIREARLSLSSEGDAVALALRWDSERAGTAEAQIRTRLLRREPASASGAAGWTWPADAPLNGQLRAQLPRIGAWSVLAPPGWRLRGSLATSLAITGTRAAPQLAGDLQANDLALRSVVDGIEFGNGRLRARLDGTRMRINEFMLQGAGDKGTGGSLTAQGDAGWLDGRPQVALTARLERLRASIRTDRQITLSGDLQATLAGRLAGITGALRIDQARILLPDEDTPQLGNDVIVRTARGVAAGQQGPAQASAPTAPGGKDGRAMKIAVQLDLGNDFRIQGKGIDTRVRGTLALTGDALDAPRLVGSVNTSGGQYRAYSQRLDIEQGLLRFSGPINNPALDILAVRPNMTQRVGVQITGTALLPRVRLYAQPEMPDAEKLSWLVVGRSSASGGAEAAVLQQAAIALLGSKSGSQSAGLAASLGLDELSFRSASSSASGGVNEGAITLGKRFSRNFYAAYERSLSGALGTLYVFYDLSQRFTVRAQTGTETAIDLILTVPYD